MSVIIGRKKLKEVFYFTMMSTLLKENEEETKTLEVDRDITKVSSRNISPESMVAAASASSRKIPEERKRWIINNLDNINPIFLKTDYPEADLNNHDEVQFYVLAVADRLVKDIESKIEKKKIADAAKKEADQLAYAEYIKNKYRDGRGGFEGTGVFQAGNDSFANEKTVKLERD